MQSFWDGSSNFLDSASRYEMHIWFNCLIILNQILAINQIDFFSDTTDGFKTQPLLKPWSTKVRGCTYCLMNCTASSYFIPLSMRAKATKTGALKGEEIQRTRSRRQRENHRKREGEQKIKCQGPQGSIVIWGRWGGGFKPGKEGLGNQQGVHRFSVALLRHGAHTLGLSHTQNCDKLQ